MSVILILYLCAHAILGELRLITWNKQTSKIKVTAKGRHYIWLAFKNRPGV